MKYLKKKITVHLEDFITMDRIDDVESFLYQYQLYTQNLITDRGILLCMIKVNKKKKKESGNSIFETTSDLKRRRMWVVVIVFVLKL